MLQSGPELVCSCTLCDASSDRISAAVTLLSPVGPMYRQRLDELNAVLSLEGNHVICFMVALHLE